MDSTNILRCFVFSLATFGITAVVDLIMPFSDWRMFVPGMVALILLTLWHESTTNILRLRHATDLVKGFSISAAACLLVVFLSELFKVAHYGMPPAAIAYHGSAIKAWFSFFSTGFPVLLIINLFFALGEEIGWRSYLLAHLKAFHLSQLKRSIIVGILWAMWHFPLLFYLEKSWVNIGLFSFNVLLLSCIYTKLYEHNKSIWAVAFAHATHNLFFNTLLPTITLYQTSNPFLLGEEGCIVTCSYVIILIIYEMYDYWINTPTLFLPSPSHSSF